MPTHFPSGMTRRRFVLDGVAGAVAMRLLRIGGIGNRAQSIELIAAPSNLGLRPLSAGHEPGAWRAPAALLAAGLESRLNPARLVELPRPVYDFEMQPATRIRNGVTLRAYALTLAAAVQTALGAPRFPVVLGGDCSILLGCLLGARRAGRCGLVHIDGHSDFFHPGNYDAGSRLGSAAGMDLALVTGRGELLLTDWPDVGRPLVADEAVIQIGDRDAETRAGPEGALEASIAQLTAQQVVRLGAAEACARVETFLERRGIERVWLHVDLDVLDQGVLPAVDSPGSPGLDFLQLAQLLTAMIATRRVLGLDVTIYDPERDERGEHARAIVECLSTGLAPLRRGTPTPRSPDAQP